LSKVGGYNFFHLIFSPDQGEYLLNIYCISNFIIVDWGSMCCNSLGGACFFFDIDVKGGESVVNFKDATVVEISRMLQWYSCMFFKGFSLMPKGDIVGMFLDKGRVCVFVIDGEDQHVCH
jgi:hypothetical protein